MSGDDTHYALRRALLSLPMLDRNLVSRLFKHCEGIFQQEAVLLQIPSPCIAINDIHDHHFSPSDAIPAKITKIIIAAQAVLANGGIVGYAVSHSIALDAVHHALLVHETLKDNA
jgi:hypothetical protein